MLSPGPGPWTLTFNMMSQDIFQTICISYQDTYFLVDLNKVWGSKRKDRSREAKTKQRSEAPFVHLYALCLARGMVARVMVATVVGETISRS